MRIALALCAFLLSFASGLSAQPVKPACIWDPSPNYTAGRSATIDTVVIHTTEGGYSGAVSWLKNPSAGASAHYVIKEDGTQITQLVADSNTSWHATYYHSRSIGIECAGYAGQASTWTQGILPKLYDLVAWLCYTYNVQAVHPGGTAGSSSAQPYTGVGLVGHYQIQPWNRSDPGAYFDWNTFVTEVNNRLNPGGGNDIIIDNVDAGYSVNSGSWSSGTSAAGKYGADYRFMGTAASATGESEWRPNIQTTGTYEVAVYYPQGTNRAPDAPFTVDHANGSNTYQVNQQTNGGAWYVLGNFAFFSGTGGAVYLRNNATTGFVVLADAVRFRFLSAAPAPSAPTGLAATAQSPTSVQFNWNWATWSDGFWLDIAQSAADLSGQTGTFANYYAGQATTYTWAGLTPNTTYYWRVYAFNTQGGNHGYPTPTSVTTPPNTGTAPTISSVTPNPATLGAVLTIDGTNLTGATVSIGGQAQSITSQSATQLIMPVHAATPTGAQTVVVTTAQGSANTGITINAPSAGVPLI
ncbi:partial N-acetylmuramoyl-L-alanine amidase A, partial [Gammaproteobacteria bacterium]